MRAYVFFAALTLALGVVGCQEEGVQQQLKAGYQYGAQRLLRRGGRQRTAQSGADPAAEYESVVGFVAAMAENQRRAAQ